ncbi:hypothetical protein K450DRAFT_252837 [Umbelopsis ramanniana AG]|uniref:BHLH domain-containing protein n=1 Tax=Umbelopsis ramanniana AG TaxID=1314678 RepID=A0AAD5HC62_UMBRA|nr:uncharacterized protein K450DRAFT_252837 [Umbelopsis ramanniana AG]KAI8577231.1 hypothetical protein K450DRAFT_252837 [Umbelopsis ramanniana AG]
MSLKKIPISERRATYPLEHRLKTYSPEKIQQQLIDAASTKKMVVNGVNILNNRSIDCSTAKERIRQRRETHNKVERQRRDILNSLIAELSDIVPCATDAKNKSQRAAVLRRTVQYVRWVQSENRTLRTQLNLPDEDITFIPYDDDQLMNEHSMPGSRSPTVESCSNSDQGDDSGSSYGSHPILSSGTFHTFSIATSDAMIDVHTG